MNVFTEYPKKIKIINPTFWNHHRFGWKWVINNLQVLSCKEGIRFISFVDEYCVRMHWIDEPWIGFIHTVPYTTGQHQCQYDHPWSLDHMLNHSWPLVGRNCKGLFTLCNYTKKFIINRINIPVESLYYPTEQPAKLFDFEEFSRNEKKLILVGHWLRRWPDIYSLKTSYNKFILKGSDCFYDRIEKCFGFKMDDSVSIIDRLNDDEYDSLLSKNIIFLPLQDCAACTTLVECIVRNTPVLIPKLEAVVEYLGEDYPLYYSDLTEAENKLKNLVIIKEANEFLCNRDKSRFTLEYFLERFVNSEIFSLHGGNL